MRLKRRPNLYIALIHYPIYNKNKKIVTTAVTSFDIHDIARLARTYDVSGFYIVMPIEAQKRLCERIINHWTEGFGAGYNPTRKEALKIVSIAPDLKSVKTDIAIKHKIQPRIITTDARIFKGSIDYVKLRERIWKDQTPYLILFGTGWGIAKRVMNSADYILKPIRGGADYNHLSVRSAASIILDRLLGEEVVR
ncbi:MAG: RNA methyltransferase [Nitrospirae bacterium]|nr:RNA methyltransferase [Nitrospirota bacterium]